MCGFHFWQSRLQTHRNLELADLILVNTCSIRETAEETVRKRLRIFDAIKRQKPGTLVGVLGCMAERLKSSFLEEERLVDLVVGQMPTAICLNSSLPPKTATKGSIFSSRGKKRMPTSVRYGWIPRG
nr:hypothetical protein [Haliscomenobacter sp.]